MAASSRSGENCEGYSTEKNSSEISLNNNVLRKENCRDLLKVCPERGLEKYLLEKNSKKVNVQRTTFKPPTCQALRQVKDFLPIIRQAQEEMSNSDHNIEDIDEAGPYINMDIQLVELDNDDSSSDSDSGCDEVRDSKSDIKHAEVTESNLILKKPEKMRKPLIEDIT